MSIANIARFQLRNFVVFARPRAATLLALVMASSVLASSGTALAVDMSGKTIVAEGISERSARNGSQQGFTYPLQIYFGLKGSRFVTMLGKTGNTRVLIEAGSNKGSKRRKEGQFIQFVTIDQSASSIRVKLDSRGAVPGFASEGFIFDIALGNGTCKVAKFRYLPDPNQQLSQNYSKTGTCTVSEGPPEGLADK